MGKIRDGCKKNNYHVDKDCSSTGLRSNFMHNEPLDFMHNEPRPAYPFQGRQAGMK